MSEIPRITVAMIVDQVAQAFKVRALDIRSQRRTADILLPRQIVCWLARDLTDLSYPFIGRQLGGRDHSTIWHSIRQIEQRRTDDPEFASLLDGLARAIVCLAETDAARRLPDIDVVALAERIERNPGREAVRVAAVEVVALATRAVALEELAGATYQLLAGIDQMLFPATDRATDRAAIAPSIAAVTHALAALGYVDGDPHPATETDHA